MHLRELEKSQAEEASKRELEQQRELAFNAALEKRNKLGEQAAVDAIGADKSSMILKFRSSLMKLMDYNFNAAKDTSEIDTSIFRETCRFLVTNSPASFAAAVSLVDPDTLHYHTSGTKVEIVPDDDEEEQQGLAPTGFARRM